MLAEIENQDTLRIRDIKNKTVQKNCMLLKVQRIWALTGELERDNRNFNFQRFVLACGFTTKEIEEYFI